MKLCLPKKLPFFPICISFLIMLYMPTGSAGEIKKGYVYVGSETCRGCHKKEYNTFKKYAKKAGSFESILRLKKGLTDAEIKRCYSCHTTGYGNPGGFESPEKTPHLKNAGCEVCHGPGSVHIKTKSRRDIKAGLTMEDCAACHTEERVRAFRYRPMKHGGAH